MSSSTVSTSESCHATATAHPQQNDNQNKIENVSDNKEYSEVLKQAQLLKKKNEEKSKLTNDELMNYIENNEKQAKGKRRVKKNQEKYTKYNSNNIDISDKEAEIEVETFKTRLRIDSTHSNNTIKTKPIFTKEWLDWILSL